jgi:hypothetical protein
MHRIRSIAVALATFVVVLFPAGVHASDPVAVYARIDRVVFGPDAQSPTTIQIFGVFSLATPNDRNEYQSPARGYLYFTLPPEDAVARREWNDLKEVAGTTQIVAFGTRYSSSSAALRVRPLNAKLETPDTYTTGFGVRKVNGNTDYPPVRRLADFRH